MRKIDVWYDVLGQQFVDATGAAMNPSAATAPYIYYKEVVLLRLRLQRGVGSPTLPVIFTVGSTYGASIDNDFNWTTDPFIRALPADINVSGNDSSTFTHDETNGKFTIQLNANNTSYGTKITNVGPEAQNCYFEFQALDDGGQLIFVARFLFRCLNLQDPGGPALPVAGLPSVRLMAPDGGVWITSVDNDGVLQTTKED